MASHIESLETFIYGITFFRRRENSLPLYAIFVIACVQKKNVFMADIAFDINILVVNLKQDSIFYK